MSLTMLLETQQGDATLEGAVYGLFAAEDLLHPDGKTGVVYRANHLVAVATTDKMAMPRFWHVQRRRGEPMIIRRGQLRMQRMDGERKRREICIHKMRRSMIIRQIKLGADLL